MKRLLVSALASGFVLLVLAFSGCGGDTATDECLRRNPELRSNPGTSRVPGRLHWMRGLHTAPSGARVRGGVRGAKSSGGRFRRELRA